MAARSRVTVCSARIRRLTPFLKVAGYLVPFNTARSTLDDVVGQEEILGEGKLLRRVIESGNIPNMIFYGPSGVGKSTLARIIAEKTNRTLHKLNATQASTAEVREILAQPDTLLAPNGVLLYLDEIQYFTKKQQQSLLESIENGKVTLIASTTENPYFYVFGAILSRSTIFEFKPITAEAALKAVNRAVKLMEEKEQVTAQPEEGALEHIASACGGDIRKAINAVELLFSAGMQQGNVLPITLADAQAATQRSAIRYDKDGDSHYDVLSAFQKSIRGSDPNAGVHYLARLLEGGDLPSAPWQTASIPLIPRRLTIMSTWITPPPHRTAPFTPKLPGAQRTRQLLRSPRKAPWRLKSPQWRAR